MTYSWQIKCGKMDLSKGKDAQIKLVMMKGKMNHDKPTGNEILPKLFHAPYE